MLSMHFPTYHWFCITFQLKMRHFSSIPPLQEIMSKFEKKIINAHVSWAVRRCRALYLPPFFFPFSLFPFFIFSNIYSAVPHASYFICRVHDPDAARRTRIQRTTPFTRPGLKLECLPRELIYPIPPLLVPLYFASSFKLSFQM